MTFPALPRTWSLDGFSFNVGADAYGHASIVDVVGWDSPPGPKPRITPRAEAHGSFSGPNYSDVSVVSITGTAQALTPVSRVALGDRLAALCLSPNTMYPLVCTDPYRGFTLTRWVQRGDRPDIRPLRDGISLSLDYQLIAVDPWKYSPDNGAQSTGIKGAANDGILWNGSPSASGGIEWNGSPTVTGGLIYQSSSGANGVIRLTNSGTVEAPITFVFSATVTNPLVTNIQTQQRIRWGGTVGGASQLTVSTKTGRAYLDNISVNATLLDADFFGVPPKGFVDIEYSAVSASGSILSATNANVYA